MRYRCQACQHEEVFGFIPPASCLMYVMALFALSTGALAGLLLLVSRFVLPPRPAPVEPPEPTPWWAEPLACACYGLLAFVGAVAIHWVLKRIEYRFIRGKPCPQCGAKRWSHGYSAGFGL